MPDIPTIWLTMAGATGLHEHQATAVILRVYLTIPVVLAQSMLDSSYQVPGLLSTDVVLGAKLDLSVGMGLGLWIVQALAVQDVLNVRLGNLLLTPTASGPWTLYALLVRPGGGGPPLQIDLTTPLAPL